MRAMILAAGRGSRMGVLTEKTPKPLLRVNDRFLIDYSIRALSDAGIKDIIINISYQAQQIKAALGSGMHYGVNILYSEEEEALETGGGIYKALPLLGPEPFIVLSADVVTAYPLQQLINKPCDLAHLVLVENPVYHPNGDFCLDSNKVRYGQGPTFTFGNIGLYRPELFANCKPGKFRLGDLLKEAIHQNRITGEFYQGSWHNIGTPNDLSQLTVSLIPTS